MQGFELSASIVLWRHDTILVMKRVGGFSSGGWFFPGGHVEPGERPVDAAARELWEEAAITVEPASLVLADVMTYDAGGGLTAHTLIYNGACPDGAECVINDEHHVARWMEPEAYIARFLNSEVLRSRGVGEAGVLLAAEVARVTRTAAEHRRRAERAPSATA